MSTTQRKKVFSYGNQTVVLETGIIAFQATASVLVSIEGTVVLVTLVCAQENNKSSESNEFIPLTVHYQERDYAVGRIPGGYFKRESKPGEYAVLMSRLVDRMLRPLFPKGFSIETQIVITVLSMNPDIDPSIPAMLGASAVLALSKLPIKSWVTSARIGYVEEQFIFNPTLSELEQSSLDMIIASTEKGILMIEAKANRLLEATVQEAMAFALNKMQLFIQVLQDFVPAGLHPSITTWHLPSIQPTLEKQVIALSEHHLQQAYQINEKQARRHAISTARQHTLDTILTSIEKDEVAKVSLEINHVLTLLERKIVRNRILQGLPRIDGRDNQTVRPITIKTGLLPRAHGSALFTRGETQVLVVVTLGTERDAQLIDALAGEYKENFILHYNFPPYSVGEIGIMGAPKRREIGHGSLAKRSFSAVLSSLKEFPYVVRIVSEVTASNGSSSMATVCGTSLALMDAGVPIQTPIAGIAMGLVKEDEKYAILTDILGDEDHLGDMDFKVAGTAEGITALQMDIKTDGITDTIMKDALEQARIGRLHILDIMSKEMTQSRQDISIYAPRILTIQIPSEKIRDVIGKGGVTIHALTEETGAVIDINDNGEIKVAAVDLAACEEAIRRIKQLTADITVGKIYEGKVMQIKDFGAIISISAGKQGLVHISQIANHRIAQVSDILHEGQMIKVKVIEVDKQGRIRLSMKEIEQK